jgi:murein tripeptide amidase MpaA
MIEECKVVWVLARQHPAETTGSYMVEGILRYLLPLISQAKTESSSSSLGQLHDYVFKIVPMVNVDGVIHGNSRA